MSVVLDIAIRVFLIWIMIGAVLWIVLDQCGVIENSFEAKRKKSGRPVTLWFSVKASVAMILVWPVFAAVAVKNRASVYKALKRVVWRCMLIRFEHTSPKGARVMKVLNQGHAADGSLPGGHPGTEARPQRIQRKRTKGSKLPPNTVVVTRGTKWGNPCVVNPRFRYGSGSKYAPNVPSAAEAVAFFREYLAECPDLMQALPELRGKNLACFCAIDQPCHADVLLELANS